MQDSVDTDGAIIVGTPSNSSLVASLGWSVQITRAAHGLRSLQQFSGRPIPALPE